MKRTNVYRVVALVGVIGIILGAILPAFTR
jgi:hypothetical protein